MILNFLYLIKNLKIIELSKENKYNNIKQNNDKTNIYPIFESKRNNIMPPIGELNDKLV